MKRTFIAWAVVAMALLAAKVVTAAEEEPVLWTGITGTITSSGLANPRYVLSFPAIQRLMLDAAGDGVTREEVEAALAGTPVGIQDLMALELLRPTGDRFQVGYLLLTVEDQQAIYRIAGPLSDDLALALTERKSDFDAILALFDDESLRDELAFSLIAGFLLNWEGLEVSSSLGYRVEDKLWPNGDRFIFHSSEYGADLPTTGLYLGSHSFPGGDMFFTTFGDGPSLPRIYSLVDVYDPVLEHGLAELAVDLDLQSAARSHLLTYLMVAMADAGHVMRTLAKAPTTIEELTERTGLVPDRLSATVDLLSAVGYIERRDETLSNAVVVLTREHGALVDSTLELGRAILTDWFTAHFAQIESDLAGLSPMENGLPFQLAFSEVWHYIFGLTAKKLAETGFYANPRSVDSPFNGFVPLVFDSSLHDLP